MYLHSRIHFIVYDDETRFDYFLVSSNGVQIFANNGRNTDIVFLFENKMKIHAKNDDQVSYIINFALGNQANIVANYIISTESARYKVSQPLVRISRQSENTSN